MPSLPFLPFLLLLLLLPLTTALKPLHYPPCAEGLHLIVAPNAPTPTPTPTALSLPPTDPDAGLLAPLLHNITANVTGSDYVVLTDPLPAYDGDDDDDDGAYAAGVRAGVRELRARLNASVAECPTSRIAVLGYGAGAEVVGDALCGTADGAVAPLNRAWGEKITAVILMGDPGHIAGQAWNVGSGTRDGISSAKRNIAQCKWYENRTRSYCDDGDVACDGGTSADVQLHYVQTYGTNATDFVIGKAAEAGVA